MNNFVLLALCFGLGMALRASGRLPEGAHGTLNVLVVNIAIPALILLHLHDVAIDRVLAQAVAATWLVFLLAVVVFWTASRILDMPRETTGSLILTGGLASTSFIGVPMIEAFYGPHGIGLGLAIDQLGSFLILATFGIFVAGICSGGKFAAGRCLRRICAYPPLVAVVVALALRPVPYPEWVSVVLGRLGDLVAPLALLSVGYQLRMSALGENLRPLALGLTFKLLLAPLALTLVLAIGWDRISEPSRITVFEMAMPPMIAAAIVAAEHRLNPPLTALMVGIGTPLAFLTLPLWWLLLARI